MRLLPVLVGLVLLLLGVTAYYSIPNSHDTPLVSLRNFAGPDQKNVGMGGIFREPVNITVTSGENSTLVVNMTVTGSSGSASSLDFRISSENNLNGCENGEPPSGCIYQGTVSNASIRVPITMSGRYYLIFDNTVGTEDKIATFNVYVRQDSVLEVVTRDGMGNWFGLGLGALGALATLYGLSRKTVIPWE